MKNTALYNLHLDYNAKFVPFSGYNMPLFYNEGIIKEHLWVRSNTGLFDVSHMGQFIISGKRSAELLSYLTPTDFSQLAVSSCKYTVLTNAAGCVIDDIIVSRLSNDSFYLVVNASRKEEDFNWISKYIEDFQLTIDVLDDYSLIAIQGKDSPKILSSLVSPEVNNLNYMQINYFNLGSNKLLISRTGYTGEDGFEISVNNNFVQELTTKLLQFDTVKLIGLGARDSLRLEMGYPLYGHELSTDINLAEASINWIISKDNNFIGSEKLLNNRVRKRVSFKLLDKAIARDSMLIYNSAHEQIGYVTSAGYSPSLECSIGQAYIDLDYSKIGTKIFINIRNKYKSAEVTKLMLLESRIKKAS